MKFKIKVGEFVEQIAQAAITVDPKSVDQPNSKVYLKAVVGNTANVLYYYSTNQLAKTFMKSEVEVLEPGDTLVDANKLLGGLQGRDPDQVVTFDAQPEQQILVTIGRNKFKLPQQLQTERMAKEVETLPFRAAAIAKIVAGQLGEFIRRTSFFIPTSSNGQQKFAMDALHLKASGASYVGQATDGGIISINYAPAVVEEGKNASLPSLLIPQDALAPLQKLLAKRKEEEIDLFLVGNELYFRMKGVRFSCSLRTGKYPNLEKALEQGQAAFEILASREELKSALLRAGNFVMGAKRVVKFEFVEDQSLKILAAGDSSDIQDQVDCETSSGTFVPMNVLMNLDYIANIVSTLTSEKVMLGFSSSVKPVTVRNTVVDEEEKITFSSTYAISPINPNAEKR